jgi:hypothetical protein
LICSAVSNTTLLGGAGNAGSDGWVLWQSTQRLTMIFDLWRRLGGP